MKAIDYHIKQAEEHGHEWVEFLATYSDKRLIKRLGIIRKQKVMAAQNQDEKGFDLMLQWEHITICARIHKEEFNIPDAPIEKQDNEIEIETEPIIILSEKRQEILTQTLKPKKIKPSTTNEDNNQLSLFN
jgi:hypothetical protein